MWLGVVYFLMVSNPPTRHKYHLALIMVVDKENHTQIAMQALLSHERTENFLFLFEMFTRLCFGAHPQVNQPYMCSVHVPVERYLQQRTHSGEYEALRDLISAPSNK